MSASNYLKNGLLDAYFGVGSTVLSLHTADPGTTGANEVSGGSYTRQSITFGSAANCRDLNSATVTFADLPACTVTHVGFWRAGNFLNGGKLTADRVVTAGDGLYFKAGDVAQVITG